MSKKFVQPTQEIEREIERNFENVGNVVGERLRPQAEEDGNQVRRQWAGWSL